jgi:hypothetical protein
MANNGQANQNSIYPQLLQMRKNSFRHATNKQMQPGAPKNPTKKQIQGDTPDPDAPDEQRAQQRVLRKMGSNAYKGELDTLTNAYGTFSNGDGGTFDAGGGKGGGTFGGK